MELKQTERAPFIATSPIVRLKRINKKQFKFMVEGIINNILFTNDSGRIWRGLYNLTSLNSMKLLDWWKEYHSTELPKIIASFARLCVKPEYFDTRGQTEVSMAVDEALKILDWIGDKKAFINLILDLIKKNIPQFFSWYLFPYTIKYSDQIYKDDLIKIAKGQFKNNSDWKDVSERMQSQAIFCLTHLEGDDVAETILKYFPRTYSMNDIEHINSLQHFKKTEFVKKLIEIIKSRNEEYFPGTYYFLWEFLPEEAIEPSLSWLKDENSKDYIQKYLLKLLGKYDKPDVNKQIIELSESQNINIVEVMDAILHSQDPKTHCWFEEKIKDKLNTKKLLLGNDDEHYLLLKWIYLNSYIDSKNYIERLLNQDIKVYISAQDIFVLMCEIINKLKFNDLLGLIKNYYFRLNPSWGMTLIGSTLKLFFKHDPNWSWKEFLKHWNDSNDFQKKTLIEWIAFMPSQESIEWLLFTFHTTGDFHNYEKEIKSSIRNIIKNLPKDIKKKGIKFLREKSSSENTKDRILSAHCCGLFGEETYKKLKILFSDSCAKVRVIYNYSEVVE